MSRRFWCAALLAALAVAPGVEASELSAAAASLQPGQSVKFYTENLWPSIFLDVGGSTSLMSYMNSGVWDPYRREVRFIGKVPNDKNRFFFVVYDEATNTWSSDRALPSALTANQSGHGYDHNAIDPATGDHYFKQYGGRPTIYKWTSATGEWSTLPEGVPGNNDIAEGMAWFPSLGLVYADKWGCRYWDGDTWNSCGDNLDPIGYHSFVEWQPNANVVIFGGGNRGDRTLYKLTSNGELTRQQTAATGLGNHYDQGLVQADPASNMFLVFGRTGRDWWEYDPNADSWRSLSTNSGSGTTPRSGAPGLVPSGTWGAELGIPIDTYGVVMYLDPTASRDGYVWLYKHSAGSSSGDTTPPSTPTNLTAEAVEFDRVTLRWSASSDDVGVTTYYVYRDGNAIGSTPTTGYTDSGLTATTTYRYEVRALDAAGNESDLSSPLTVTTAELPPVPPPPTALQLTPPESVDR